MASRAERRLGDILAATAPVIRRARHPFAYEFVCAGRDWAAIAREKDRPAGAGDAPTPAYVRYPMALDLRWSFNAKPS